MTTLIAPAPVGAPAPAEAGARADDRARARRTRRRLRDADLLEALCIASAAAAAALWLAAGGLADATTPAGIVTALGIVSGLIGTDLVLVMLVLAARIPLIDRTFGQDKAIALHRQLGKPALLLILAHAVLLTVGYSMMDGLGVLAEALSLLSASDILLGAVGLGLMIAVVVTSLVAVRRHFPYELWQGIHMLSYAAVAVAIPHQLEQGHVLAESSWQRAYWIGLYVIAFGSLAWYRFALPTIRSLRHGLRVTAVEPIADGVYSVHLRGRALRRLGALGGQYAIWRFWTPATWWHAHPISFSAVPGEDTMRITIRELGEGTRRLARLHPGTRVSIEGPYGAFTPLQRTMPNVALAAAGIGVTSIRALLEQSRLRDGEATVLLRADTAEQVYLWEETAALAARSRTPIYAMLGGIPRGVATWMSPESLERGVTIESVFPKLLESDLYVCGPSVWAEMVIRDAKAAGLPDAQIHVERFDW